MFEFGFEFSEFLGLDMEGPFEIGTHLALHSVDLAETEDASTNATLGFVGVLVFVYDLGGDEEGRDKEVMTAGSATGGEIFRRERRKRAQKVTEALRQVRWRA